MKKSESQKVEAANEFPPKPEPEELQSVNEEFVTVNRELKIEIEEFSLSVNDFQNLLGSTGIGTIFLDRAFRIKLFTSAAGEIFNLIPTDVGRLLSDITHKLDDENLIADIETALSKLQPIEREVRTGDGDFYLMQITPYRTAEDRINGTIITFVNITKGKQAEESLRESVQNLERQTRIFDTTLSSITDFNYIFDRDGRFVYANQSLLDLLGITLAEISGKNFFDLNYPEDLAARLQSQIRRVFETGETVRDETPFTAPTGASGYYEYIFSPVTIADDSIESVAGSTRDITTRKRLETNVGFSAEISRDLTTLSGINEIMRNVGAKIGAYLDLSVCAFIEANQTEDAAVINHAWHRKDVPDVIGAYRISEYLSDEFQKAGRAGENFIINDTQTDSRAAAAAYARLKIGSFLSVPIIENDEWRFMLIVYKDAAHVWQADEIELMNDLTTRIWARLERARSDEALRESEAKYRQLFDSIDEGFSVVELIFDENEKPVDYRFLEANLVFEKQTGLVKAVGKTAREMVPNLEEFWFETYGKVALTGESVRFEKESEPMNRTFDFFASRVGGSESRQVAVIFEDITDRKRAEEKLRESEERLRLIINSVKDYSIVTTDINGIINGWNPGAEKMFGYAESEIIGRKCEILFTPEDREKDVPAKEIRAALERGSVEDERFHIRKDGSRFFSAGVIQTFKDGEVDGFVKISRDMTERLAAEQIGRDRQMLQKLVGAQEDERRRIARDLHDELGQLLTGLRLKLEAVRKLCEDDGELCGKIDETQTLARRIDDGIDFLAWELRPAALDHLGLHPALEKYVKEWSHYSGVTAELLGSNFKKTRLAPEAETNLYRIAQESMNNAYKHAEAGRVEVSLEKRGEDTIVLIISDDGKGFKPEDKMNRSKGIGLIGMRERAILIGGTLEIESVPGNGTTIFVRVPIKTETTK